MKYKCVNCDNISLKWEGRCSACGEWGSYEEFEEVTAKKAGLTGVSRGAADVQSLKSIYANKEKVELSQKRLSSGFDEFDRVLGGGYVPGEVVILSGEPGIGKSTLLLQSVVKIAKSNTVLYVTAEESVSQFMSRVERIGGSKSISANLLVSSEVNLESIVAAIESEKPDFVVVDSIQAIVSERSTSYPGSIAQVRLCGVGLTEVAKRLSIPLVIVGQINKEGGVAGPKILEHTVDCVLYMEGQGDGYYRMLKGLKNRYGSTFEVGVFEMESGGLMEVMDPSSVFIEGTDLSPGSCLSALVNGSRVVFVEIQALVVERGATAGPLRRVATGISRQRLEMLCAVLTRHTGVFLGDKDVFVNVAGGIKAESPSVDLAVCAAIKSSAINSKSDPYSLYVGEVGLTGRISGFLGLDAVMKEAGRLGYKKIVTPQSGKASSKVKVTAVKSISKVV
ncbi:MAG: DNA repair protein RadA [Candidatus Dojkabacteria bacterium]|nr:MAG: DNA repair protein RadA [Candidatus Dojkabacteria bacterium]